MDETEGVVVQIEGTKKPTTDNPELTPLPVKGVTGRGFGIYGFVDRYGEPCSLQESSLATEACIWLGCDALQLQIKGWHPEWSERYRPMTDEEQKNILTSGRMHLTQEQVAALIPLLQHFVETGELP